MQQVKEYLSETVSCEVTVKRLKSGKHIFSHVEWHMKGYMIQTEAPIPGDWEYVPIPELKEKYPIPNAFSAYTEGLL